MSLSSHTYNMLDIKDVPSQRIPTWLAQLINWSSVSEWTDLSLLLMMLTTLWTVRMILLRSDSRPWLSNSSVRLRSDFMVTEIGHGTSCRCYVVLLIINLRKAR